VFHSWAVLGGLCRQLLPSEWPSDPGRVVSIQVDFASRLGGQIGSNTSLLMSGYGVPCWIETSPSQIAVWRQGWSRKCLVTLVRLRFRSLNRLAWSLCIHARKCQVSSLLRWHDGHRVEPWWGCAFKVCSGSLSLMNKRMHHWLPGENNSSAECRAGQLT